MSKGVWSTCKDRSLKKCRFGLIFHGGTEFSETVKVRQSKRYSQFLDAHAANGALLSHLRTKTPGVIPPPELEPTNSELEDGDDTVQLTEDEEMDMDMENRPDMDIPTGFNATDFAASVPWSNFQKTMNTMLQTPQVIWLLGSMCHQPPWDSAHAALRLVHAVVVWRKISLN